MRLVCVSDTHNQHAALDVPEGDALLFAGDMCGHGDMHEVKRFCRWLRDLPHEHKVVVAGNHDWPFDPSRADLENEHARRYVEWAGAHYLQDATAEVAGLTVYGSPWQPWFYDWAFNLPRDGDEIRERWAAIPDDTDVLVTHGPPLGYGDEVERGRVGCALLAERIKEVRPLLHVSGHIHEGYGVRSDGHTRYVNASVLDRWYRQVNAPVVIDL